MRTTIFGLLLLAATVRAQVAIHLNDGQCYAYNSEGTGIVEGIGRLTYTRGFNIYDAQPGGVGVWTCQIDQGFRAGQMVRYDYANTGQPCGLVIGNDVQTSTIWRETISVGGRITLECTLLP